jgi:hypothetical protein
MRAPTRSRAVVVRFLLLVVLSTLPVVAAAQGTGVLTGRILDSAGTPVAAARIRIPELERVSTTDSAGRFRIDMLPAGRLTVIAEAPGYFGSRASLLIPRVGEFEHSYSLRPNAQVLSAVEVRARSRQQLPARLAEFAMRQSRGTGRFLGPDQLEKFNGQPLTEALKTILTGARFERSADGQMSIVSARALQAPTSMRLSANIKSCGVQIWENGVLLSDPNSTADIAIEPSATARSVTTLSRGAPHDYDISALLSNDYMAVEYYSDLSTTPPGFRTGTASCGVLALWTRVPMEEPHP